MTDLSAFCQHFYASHYLPIAYYEEGSPLYSAGFPNGIPLYQSVIHVLVAAQQNPAVYTSSDMGIYGIIRIESTGSYFLLCPAYSDIISADTIRAYMTLNAVKKKGTGNCPVPFSYSSLHIQSISKFACVSASHP